MAFINCGPIDINKEPPYHSINKVLQCTACIMSLGCEWSLIISLGGNKKGIAIY